MICLGGISYTFRDKSASPCACTILHNGGEMGVELGIRSMPIFSLLGFFIAGEVFSL